MLQLHGEPFTTGRCDYYDNIEGGQETSAKIYVAVQFEGWEGRTTAQIDTGAAWSILNNEVAEELGLFEIGGEEIEISTRIGSITGLLVKAGLTIVAQEGESLEFNPTVFVSREWTRHTFLGYGGLLQFVRFAIDPQNNDFHFGCLA